MKKSYKYLLIIMGALLFTPNVKALSCDDLSSEEMNYIIQQTDPNDLDLSCSNGTPYSDEYLSSIEDNTTNFITPYYFTNKLNVTAFQQTQSYYCGYAATKEVIHYINGSSESQDYYANYMGNPSSSAYVYKITNTLNALASKTYNYVLGTAKTQSQFQTMLEQDVAAGKPIILHAITNTLEMYNGNLLYHYIVATGNTVSNSYPYSVFYVDSHSADYGNGNVFGEHLDTIENVFGTVNRSGRYIIY